MGTLSRTYRVNRATTRPQSVLVVDRNPAAGESLSCLLRTTYGPLVPIQMAHSGRQTLELLRKTSFELVLIDYHLDDMDGLELLGQVLDCTDQTAVLMTTNEPSNRLAAEALRQGASDYFVKEDCGSAELEQLITQALRTVRLEYRHRQSVSQWRLDQTERSDQIRAMTNDLNIHVARLERWVRHASTSTPATLADESLRHIGSELRQLQRLVTELVKLSESIQAS